METQSIFAISRLLSVEARKKLLRVTIFQGLIAFLDILGLSLLLILASGLLSELRGLQPPEIILKIMSLLGLMNSSFLSRTVVLALGVISLFITKTIVGLFSSRYLFNFLALQTSILGDSLISKVFSQDYESVARKKGQRLLHAATGGVDTLVLTHLGNAVVVTVEATFLLVIFAGIFIIDPLLALLCIGILGSTLFILHSYIGKRSRTLSIRQLQLGTSANQILLDSLSIYRELYLSNRTEFPVNVATKIRSELNEIKANLSFLPNLNKYILELVVVLASFVIAATVFIFSDATTAINKLILFIAVTTRITPSMLRIQNATLSMKQSEGTIEPTLDLIKELEKVPIRHDTGIDFKYLGFKPSMSLEQVSFTYNEQSQDYFKLENINLEISPGEFVAIVGPSGAGKSTLVDLMLGFRGIDGGKILLSGMSPKDAISNWPGAIAFVPQNTIIIDGSIRDNITLGASLNDEFLQRALLFSELSEFVNENPDGIDFHVGERGSKLSGGQRQRLGIARAIYTNPKMIILDEATSSLDVVLEKTISQSILNLSGEITVIVIAHRLSTIRDADRIAYIENGKISAVGNFQELISLVPNFGQQVKLSGLS